MSLFEAQHRRALEGAAPLAVRMRPRSLDEFVGQLLDISRLQAGRLVLERRETDLVALVQGALEAARATTAEHSLSFEGPSALCAHVDPLRLEQVLTNLVDNAIKYSPAGGPIRVRLTAQDGGIEITVADRGLGVAPEHRPRMFDRFFQAHGERRFGGMGLGLYISRQIVELHGGVLRAEHPAEGGTCMLLRLPGTPATAGSGAE